MSTVQGQPATAEAVPPGRTLKQRVLRGSMWWIILAPIKKVVSLGANVALAWLLAPQIFGVMALAEMVLRGIHMFSQTGIRASLIQNRRDDPDFVNTAWTVQVIRGVAIWIVASAVALPMARLYEQPVLGVLVPVVAVGSLLAGFQSTSLATLNRKLHERPLAMLSLGEMVISRAMMIVVALIWPSVWALAAGTLAAGLFHLIASHTLLAGMRNRFRWEPEAARTLFRFGRWIFIGTIIAFFSSQLDKLLLGKISIDGMDAVAMLGVYMIAKRFALLPESLVGIPTDKVVLPAMSETARERRKRLGDHVRRIRRVILWPTLSLCLGVMLVSPLFFGLLYDDRYAAARWMAPLVALGVWFDIMNRPAREAMIALGHPRPLTFAEAANVTVAVVACLVGLHLFGVPGFIVGLILGKVVRHAYVLAALWRAGINLFASDAAMTALLLLLAGLGLGSVALAHDPSVDGLARVVAWVSPALLLLGSAAVAIRGVRAELR